MGALEADVLDVLWRSGDPMTPSQVLDDLGTELAYTTVMTILTRLHKKGLVDRSRAGRAFAYLPRMSEAELAATRMRSALISTSDQRETMGQFVGSLSDLEAEALRAALEDMDR
jgi:predicted transcriptional regulator